MPIRANLRKFYGREWREVTRPRILARAGNCCERCRKPNRVTVETYSRSVQTLDGRLYQMWYRTEDFLSSVLLPGAMWMDHRGRPAPEFSVGTESRYIDVVLTIAHLNHQAGDDRDENLQALCQWCHLIHDRGHHFESRATRKDESRPLFGSQPQDDLRVRQFPL